MPLENPVEISGAIRGAYVDEGFDVGGERYSLLQLLQYILTALNGGGGDTIYIESDWVVKGSADITINSENTGVYEVTIPEGKSVSSLQTRIIDPETELDEEGNMIVNIAWNTTDFNLGYITALTPFVLFLDETGNQLTPAELGINVTSTAASGLTSTTIGILGSLDTPFSVKLIF